MFLVNRICVKIPSLEEHFLYTAELGLIYKYEHYPYSESESPTTALQISGR